MSITSSPPVVPATGTGRARFLAACHRQPADATPIWFMRQAGRCLPAYRALKENYTILHLARTPELAAEITLMPVDTFAVDAAVLFADIMLPLQGMGFDLDILQGGPVIHNPVRSLADVERLRVIEPEEDVPFVLEAVRLVRRALGERKAVIGFSGAPFTLACYIIEGGPSRDYGTAKSLMYREPETWHALMAKVTAVVIAYLRAQVAAGVDVVQLFDSWVGALNPADYRRYVQPYSSAIFTALAESAVPAIHFGTMTAGLLEALVEAGGSLISVDHRVNLDEAWARIGYDRGIQGNLDATRLLAGWAATEEGAREVLHRAAGRPGHIFNLGHGVLPQTDPALLTQLVAFVHEQSAAGVALEGER